MAYTGQGTLSFGYDASGNLAQVSGTAFSQEHFTRTHTNNRINGFTYDNAGHIGNDGTNTYLYGPGGRLSQTTTPQTTRTYKYDGEGRRRIIEKPDGTKELLFYTDSGQILSKFTLPISGAPTTLEDVVYLDGERIATRRYPELSDPGNSLRSDVVASDVQLNWTAPTCTNKVDVRRATVKDFTDGTTIASGVSAASYTDVGEGAVLSNKFYLVFGPQPSLHFHVNDHLGSTRLVIDQDKKIEGMYENFPFGGVKSETCSQLTGGFHGKERDEATGIEDYGLRHYASKLARFLTPDPTKQAIDFGQPISWNAYIFNLNNPMQFVDPDGAASKDWLDRYVSFRVGMIPWAGDIYDLGSSLVGIDLITGEKLTGVGRVLTFAAGIIPLVPGKALRGSKEVAEEVAENRGVRRGLIDALGNAGSRGGRAAFEAAKDATLVAAGEVRRGIERAIRPGGRLIGRAGTDESIRVVKGGQREAEDLFLNLAAGGVDITHKYPKHTGILVELPGGGRVGFRSASRSGGAAIDVNIPGLSEISKIHFEP